MTRDDALQQILDDRSLTPVDRNMLQVLVMGADETHRARYSVRALASVVGVNEKTARRSLESLEARRYIATVDDDSGRAYRPFPYVRVEPEEANRHRIHFNLVEGKRIYSCILKDESELVVLADDARRKKDTQRHRELLQLIDVDIDIRGRLENFFDVNGDPGIQTPDYYEAQVPRA